MGSASVPRAAARRTPCTTQELSRREKR